MNVLVTGGTGYLGRAIVALADRPRPSADRAGETRGRRGLSPARPSRATFAITGRCVTAVRGVDGVIHAAALVSMWQEDAADFDRINVGGLETAARRRAPHRADQPALSSRLRFWPCRRPARHGRSKPTITSARRCGRARWRERPPRAALPDRHRRARAWSMGRARFGGKPRRPSVSRSSRRPPAGNHRGRSHLVVLVCRRRRRTLTCGRSRAASRARSTSPAARTLAQMRAFELLRAARGTPLPRRIPGPLAQLVAAWEENGRGQGGGPHRSPEGRYGFSCAIGRWTMLVASKNSAIASRRWMQGINRLLAGRGMTSAVWSHFCFCRPAPLRRCNTEKSPCPRCPRFLP